MLLAPGYGCLNFWRCLVHTILFLRTLNSSSKVHPDCRCSSFNFFLFIFLFFFVCVFDSQALRGSLLPFNMQYTLLPLSVTLLPLSVMEELGWCLSAAMCYFVLVCKPYVEKKISVLYHSAAVQDAASIWIYSKYVLWLNISKNLTQYFLWS